MRLTLISVFLACGYTGVHGDASISKFLNSLTLSSPFDPIQAAYWTGLPHHRRTPFAISPDGKSGYVAYLDASLKNIVVQQVDTTLFTAVGTAVTFPGKEAAGLVAHDDGFAVMATVAAEGTTAIPPNDYPIVKLFRYTNGVRTWATALNGPGIHPADGLTATPDANGDLVFNEKSGLYGAYFVVTAYTGWAEGHFGDSIQYVNRAGALQSLPQSSTFGCSHNTGIAFEAADEVPYASICAEDHGAIWLNTDTRTMGGIKIANENATNGASGEPMGGMSGSYSNLARFTGTTNYIFAWQSRGSVNLTPDAWMGTGFTQSSPRWLVHNVAVATLSAKNKLNGPQAISTVGAAEGDTQVNWITKSSTEDHQNIHVGALNSKLSLVTWETLVSPTCKPVPLGCTGTYVGTSFQVIDSTGAKVGGVVNDKNVFVSGDMANVGTDKVCWPYVDIVWDLSRPKSSGGQVTKLSFACATLGEDGSVPIPAPAASSSVAVSVPPVVSSSAAVASSSSISVTDLSTTATVRPASTTTSIGAIVSTLSATSQTQPEVISTVEETPASSTFTGVSDITSTSSTTLTTSIRAPSSTVASAIATQKSTTRRVKTTHTRRSTTVKVIATSAALGTSEPVATVVVADCHSRRKRRHGHANVHA